MKNEHELQLSGGFGGRRFERERGFGDDGFAERELQLALRPIRLAGGGVDSRGGARLDAGAGPMPAASHPADARLWRAVREALLHAGYRNVEASVRDGLITLEGTVDDIPTRVMAEDCCFRLPEVREVRNHLRVLPAAPLEREVGG